MHNILGIVKVVIGQVFAIAVDGTQRELHEGDRIFAGEEIVTGANGALTVNLSDGHTMDMGRNSHWSDQSGVTAAANTEHATDDVVALQQAITEGVDPTKALEATAAGNEEPIEAGTGGGGHFIERVDLTGEVLDVTSGFATNSLNSQISGNREFDTFSAPIDNVQDTDTNPTLTQTVQQTPTNNAVPVDYLTPLKTVEQPLVETPRADRPSEIPATELTPAEDPHTEQPPVETPHLDRPSGIPATELTPAEGPHTEQPPVETPHLDRPSEIPATELTSAEGPHTEQPPVETPHLDRPSEIPATELTPAEVPHTEQPPVETPHLDRPSGIPATELTPAELPRTEQPPVGTPHLDRPSEIPATELTPTEVPRTEQPPVETPHLDRPSDIPATELTPAEVPQTEQPPVETPHLDRPSEIPATELTPAEGPHTEQPPVETPHLDRPSEIPATELTPAEMSHTEQPPVDTPHLDRPSDIPATELTPAEVPRTEQPPVETPHLDRPSEIPARELTPAEMPHAEQPPVETPHLDRPSEIPATELTTAFVPQTELTPAKHHDHINITIDSIVTETTPPTVELHDTITRINGGSESPDGFDVKDGKIVSIGSNVRIYLSEGDVEPQCADPVHQIQHYNDGNQNGDGHYSDIFVVHPGSQYRQGDGTFHALNAINGNTQAEQGGHKDYVFVQDGKDTDYHVENGTNNNSQTNVNTQESVSITGSDGQGHTLDLHGINHIEGVILGDGTVHTQNVGSTSVETDTPAEKPTEQHSIVTGTVTGDVDLGDIVKLTISDHHYKGVVVDLGDGHKGYHIDVDPADLKTGESIHVSITVKDETGHYTTATADHDVSDDQLPGAPSSDAPAAAEAETHTPEPHSQITHINGGSETADGFDVQDGKIVSIGSNVHVWLSEGDSEPKCADPKTQINHYKDGNVNGDGSHADVFVVHDGSGYTRDGNHQGLNGINGTTQSVDGGHKDYVFLQDGKESDFEFSFSSNNNAQTNVNTLDNVTVTGNGGQGLHLQGMNHLEGVIYGDGTVHTPNEGRTLISHSDAPVSEAEHSLLPAAPPAPLAEENAVHAVVEHHTEQSHSLNNLLENSDDLFLPAPASSADSASHQSGSPDLVAEKGQHVDDRINLSDLAHELEHGSDITSLIKGTEQSGNEPTIIDPKAHAAPVIVSESAGMDSMQHSSFDHLLHKPEHQY